jgi:uncharacterized protein (TIGR02265 family)
MQVQAPSSPTKRFTAQGSMFEGLYLKVLKPSGSFRADLIQAGFDPKQLQPEYPMSTWVACLDVSAKHLHPGVDRFTAWRYIGNQLIEGFLQTLVGRLVATGLPFMSPQSLVNRGPRMMKMAVKEIDVSVKWFDSQHAVTRFVGPHEGAAFVGAGVLEVCLRRIGVKPILAARALDGYVSELETQWVR